MRTPSDGARKYQPAQGTVVPSTGPTSTWCRLSPNDLHRLLGAADVPGPYVLVGHSAGGLLVQLYARTYPGDLAAVVAMNPVPSAGPWLAQAVPR
jgi:pimeloyl-ACP methyl ester carboxylesterase